jgi:catechol 2,3-dioxygenase-like lactoylglutathione lyase family enzyme
MTATRLQHVSIGVPRERVEEVAQFYATAIGMQRIDNLAGLAWLQFGDGDHLHLLDEQPNPTVAHLALQVDDLSQTLDRVRSAGCSAERSDDLWGAERWFIRDPVGNLVELFDTPPPFNG